MPFPRVIPVAGSIMPSRKNSGTRRTLVLSSGWPLRDTHFCLHQPDAAITIPSEPLNQFVAIELSVNIRIDESNSQPSPRNCVMSATSLGKPTRR